MHVPWGVVAGLAALSLAAGGCSLDQATEDTEPRQEVIGSLDTPRGPVFEPPPIPTVTRPAESWFESACQLPDRYLNRIWRGYHEGRSPELVVVPREPNRFGGFIGQSHSGPWDYLQEVPLVFYGPGYIRDAGTVNLQREVTLADVAPTIAELLGIPGPNHAPKPLQEVLVPAKQRPSPPALIVTMVWDGGGYNVLRAWPKQWPYLASLMRDGASLAEATVGSSPSVTPAIHTTLGTGAFPKQHGITGIHQEVEGRVVSSFKGGSAQFVEVPTLADSWDLAMDNRAKVGLIGFKSWHLGMMGHGSLLPGADRDIAGIVSQGEELFHNPDYYTLPSYMNKVPGLHRSILEVDNDDGKIDGEWMGHRFLDEADERRHSPVWTLYQTTLIKTLIRREGFGRDNVSDLFFTNYKQMDQIGHRWNMLLPEMRPTLTYLDAALEELTNFLDRSVGRKRWVLVLTADHGQGPLAEVVHGWPIRASLLQNDIAAHFDVNSEDFFDGTSPVGYWFDERVMAARGMTLEDIADFIIDYRLEDNSLKDEEIPKQYESRLAEPIIAAAFPSRELPRILRCARAR
jgi:hypothetical protein